MKKRQLVNLIQEQARKVVKNELKRLIPELKKRIISEVKQSSQNDVDEIMGSSNDNFAQAASQRINEYHGPQNRGSNGNQNQQMMYGNGRNQNQHQPQNNQNQRQQQGDPAVNEMSNKWKRLFEGMQERGDQIKNNNANMNQAAKQVQNSWKPGSLTRGDELNDRAKRKLNESKQKNTKILE